ncbi:MAG: dihydroorotase [Planctomycetota bacterium]
MKTRIRNATVVLPGELNIVDVILEDNKIADIDAAAHLSVDEQVDGTGLHLIPGVVDDQVHFRDPGLTHKEDLSTASHACAKGGVTSFLEMPNTKPNTVSVQALHDKLKLASTKSLVNYGFYIGATPDNVEELKTAQRTPGIKIFIGSSTGDLLVDEQQALETIFAETTLPITAHCEDEQTVRANRQRLEGTTNVADHSRIRDVNAAVICTNRAFELAKSHNHRFHLLHTSTGAEADILKERNDLITAEACPHHLFFNTDDYDRLGTLVQMNPSLKSADDNARLWQALLDGDIQVIATDHAPHTLEEKQQNYPASPSGLPAVENSLALMLNQVNQGRCTLNQVVHWMCDAPARVWDLMDKCRIERGYDADVVLLDMNLAQVIKNEDQVTKCGWSPWHGTELTGWAVRTWVQGVEVFRNGSFLPVDKLPSREIQFDHARGGYWKTS